MAVAVDAAAFVILDEAYRIVEVSPAAGAVFGPLRGQDVFESFPGSRPLFLPYYEQARLTGEVVEFTQYYGGYVANVKAVPSGSMLTVYWDRWYTIDVLTLEGLRDSLRTVIDALRGREDALRGDGVRGSLRVVQSGP